MDIRASTFPETIHAVVIGVGKCADPSLAELGAAPGEARRVHAELVSANACRIPEAQAACLTVPTETTRVEILSTLRRHAAEAKPGDILVIFFAGHGVERGSSFALVPSDGIAAHDSTLITAADIGAALTDTKARGVLVVADCCGGAGIYENARTLFGGIDERLEFRILLSSSKRGESSWEIKGRGSPFTAALVEALRGQMPDIGKQGEIYFTSLMAHVTSRVAELLEGEYSDLPPQHPNFDGSYQKDPLLFVNSDIAIGRLVLKTARYSPEYVRRRVTAAVGGLLAVLAIAITAYWTWIDQHFFFKLDGEQVTLYHGYPNFPWPGMPRQLWQYSIYRSLLVPGSPLDKDQVIVIAKTSNIDEALAHLEPTLTTTGKLYLASTMGQFAKAREIAKAAFDGADKTVNPVEMLGIYADIGAPDDNDRAKFEAIVENDTNGLLASVAFPALLRLDPDRAVAALKDSKAKLNPYVIFGFRFLQPPCSDTVRNFLYNVVRTDQPNFPGFGMSALIQAKCRESALPFFTRRASTAKAFGYFGRLQSDKYRRTITTRIIKNIKELSESGWDADKEKRQPGWWIEQLAFSEQASAR